MGSRLTDRLIQNLQAPATGNQIFYDAPARPRDDYTSGFGVRITAAGHKSFILNYRTKSGRDRRLTIGSPPAWSLVAAREHAAELRHRVDAGEDPLADRAAGRKAPTMRDLAERFEKEALPSRRPSTAREYRALLGKEILPRLGSLKVAAVTSTDIDHLHHKLSQRAPYRANRCAALLSKMFSLAMRWKMRPDNPAKGLQRNHEEKRARYLSAAELPALIGALNAHGDRQAANIFQLLLLTGARRGEVLSARWEQFDLQAGTWVKPSSHTKQKLEHRVPLSEAALKLLRGIEQGQSKFVFPARSKTGHRIEVKTGWAKICKAAGISGLRMHDLRHSYASMLVNSGLSLPVIGTLLGHSQAATTHRYSHLADDPLRAATERVGKLITDAKV